METQEPQKAAPTVDAMRKITLDRLLLESDSPFQKIVGTAPTTPRIVHRVAKWVAEVKGLPLEVVADVTWANTRKFYKY
jgi:TatD DNase family protein